MRNQRADGANVDAWSMKELQLCVFEFQDLQKEQEN